jgi:phosphoribosylanthranilate isomerase
LFHVKICGVCHQGDLPAIAAAGADAVGLNFYPQSKRFLSEREADKVAAAVPHDLARVGVFVNATGAAMLASAQRFGLDYLQLHGDEPPEQLAELRAYPVIKAFRFGEAGWQPIESYLSACKQRGALPVAVLIDGPAANDEFGGTGRTADWAELSDWRSHVDLPLVLAGGLTAGNVAQAIERVRPSAVDTASGVEQSPRRKNDEAVRSFVASAREALVKFAQR